MTTNERINRVKLMPEFGKKISGSKWYRTFCPGCFTPMRMVSPDSKKLPWCEECTLRPHFGGSTTMEDDGGPWQQNAVRAMEDNI